MQHIEHATRSLESIQLDVRRQQQQSQSSMDDIATRLDVLKVVLDKHRGKPSHDIHVDFLEGDSRLALNGTGTLEVMGKYTTDFGIVDVVCKPANIGLSGDQ